MFPFNMSREMLCYMLAVELINLTVSTKCIKIGSQIIELMWPTESTVNASSRPYCCQFRSLYLNCVRVLNFLKTGLFKALRMEPFWRWLKPSHFVCVFYMLLMNFTDRHFKNTRYTTLDHSWWALSKIPCWSSQYGNNYDFNKIKWRLAGKPSIP